MYSVGTCRAQQERFMDCMWTLAERWETPAGFPLSIVRHLRFYLDPPPHQPLTTVHRLHTHRALIGRSTKNVGERCKFSTCQKMSAILCILDDGQRPTTVIWRPSSDRQRPLPPLHER